MVMYVSIRKYKPKKSLDSTYYLYLCESYREDDKVMNKQYKFATLTENDIFYESDVLIREKTIGHLGMLHIKHNIKFTDEEKNSIWLEIQEKLEFLRDKIVKENPYRQKYNSRNKTGSYEHTYSDFFNTLSNYKNSNYTDEEKTLFKEMFKDMAKKYHPDIAKDDGNRMQLLLKIRDNVL